MKVFVGFFGMNRSLVWTARSINEKILAPIRAVASGAYIAGHFNTPTSNSYSSPSNSLKSCRNTGLDQIGFDMLWLEQQADKNIKKYIDFIQSHALNSIPTGEIQMIWNHLQQLHSLQRLWEVMNVVSNEEFQIFVFVRPDLEYLDHLEFNKAVQSVTISGEDLITPHWHQWGGLNDRIAICSAKGARAYLNRLDYFREFVGASQKVHSESLLAYVAERESLKLGFSSLRGVRVRANGRTKLENFHLTPLQWTKYKVRNAKAILRTALNDY